MSNPTIKTRPERANARVRFAAIKDFPSCGEVEVTKMIFLPDPLQMNCNVLRKVLNCSTRGELSFSATISTSLALSTCAMEPRTLVLVRLRTCSRFFIDVLMIDSR